MAYYDSFLTINKAPATVFREHLQAVVNDGFANAPTYYEDVEEEQEFGSMIFKPIDVRVNNLVDAKTGQRVNDDYKKLIFQDNTYMPPIGTRYRFNNNIWICFSTDNIKTTTASIYVRRCNNTLKMQNEFGVIHEEPCYIDYSVTETQIFKDYSIDIARGRIVVYCQLNKYTENTNINDRFIFGKDAYRVRFRTRFDRRYTYDASSTDLLYLQLEYDNVAEDDNIVLGVANYKNYHFELNTIDSIKSVVNDTGYIDVSLTKGDTKYDRDYSVSWNSTDDNIASIDNNGNYVLKNVGECKFICTLNENSTIFTTVDVTVLRKTESVKEVIISPEVTYLRLNNECEYSVIEYVNGKPTDTTFTIKAYNVPTENYEFSATNSSFRVKNLLSYSCPLEVVCINNNDNTETLFHIELGGLF